MGRHLTRWLIPLPAIILSFWPTIVRADAQPGLNAIGYIINQVNPTRSDTVWPTCGSEIENNINRNFDYEPFQQCANDMFMVHYTGYITIPANNTIKFMVAADDGGTVKIGTTEFGAWNLKGCSWSAQTSNTFEAGIYPLDGWYYEWGGNTCYMLAWNINNTGWQIVPDSAFTTTALSTTTTMPPTTTSSSTTSSTTTLPETTTTTSTTSSTTTLPNTTTTIQSSTTTSIADTTTTTSTTIAPSPTTTQPPSPPTGTTSTSSTSLPAPTTTTTIFVPEPEPTTVETYPQTTVEETTTTSTTTTSTTTTTQPEPTTTIEETTTTVEETTTTVDLPDPDPTVPESSSTSLPAETTPPTSQPTLKTDIPQTTQPEEESSSTTTLPDSGSAIEEFVAELDIKQDEPISDAKVKQILEVLADAAPAQIVAAIEQVLATNITSDQAVSIASSPEVLAAITQDQAEAIFEEIVVEELTPEVAEELVAALNEAPTKVKKAFQETINVFAGVFDSFRMVGQTIPVGERRTLVAVSNTLVAVGASLRRRENK